jgi:hypothetical protein
MTSPLRFGGDEMRDFRCAGQIEAMHAFLHQPIGIGDALVLAQMLYARFHKESFDHPACFGRIFEHAAACYIKRAAAAKLGRKKEKGRPSPGGPSASPGFLPKDQAIQNGLFISRCASQRVIPMSRKVASLKPSSSCRERVRRCHSAMRSLS